MQKLMKLLVATLIVMLVLSFILVLLLNTKRTSVSRNFSKGVTMSEFGNIPAKYLKQDSFKECVRAGIDQCMGEIISEEIIKSGDIKLCDDYITDNMRKSCKMAFATRNAVKNDDLSKCDVLNGDEKGFCAFEVVYLRAIKNKNIDLCNQLNDDNRKRCVNRVASRLALDDLNSDICNKIEDKEEKESCIDDVDVMREDKKMRAEKKNNNEVISKDKKE